MSSNRPAPIIVGLDYPDKTGHDFPTAGLPSPVAMTVSDLNNIDSILNQPSSTKVDMPLATLPGSLNTCYRDAALTQLLSLDPFLKFLDHVFTVPSQNQSKMLQSLKDLATTFWDDSITPATRRRAMRPHMNGFWTEWVSRQLSKPGEQDDAPGFVRTLFNELKTNDINVATTKSVFQWMFQSQFIMRRALECQCSVKQRKPFDGQENRWTFDINISSAATSLKDAIEHVLHTCLPTSVRCSVCGQSSNPHDFIKYRQLPEVVFVNVSFATANGRGLPRLRPRIPEVLDFSKLQDKPILTSSTLVDTAPAVSPNMGDNVRTGARSTLYQLQSVVDYVRAASPAGSGTAATAGHYRCNVRRKDDKWECLDATSNSVAQGLDLHDVENDRTFQPRLLAYVREQPSPSNDGTISVTTSTDPVPHSQSQVTVTSTNWNKTDWAKMYADAHLAQPPRRTVECFHSNWVAFQVATDNDKFKFYKVSKLRTMMQLNGVQNFQKITKKADMIRQLQAHSAKAAQPQPSQSTVPLQREHDQLQQEHDQSLADQQNSKYSQLKIQQLQDLLDAKTKSYDQLHAQHEASKSFYTKLQAVHQQAERRTQAINQSILQSVNSQVMLLVTITVPGRNDRRGHPTANQFLIPLPYYRFVRWRTPTTVTTVDQPGTDEQRLKVIVTLFNQSILTPDSDDDDDDDGDGQGTISNTPCSLVVTLEVREPHYPVQTLQRATIAHKRIHVNQFIALGNEPQRFVPTYDASSDERHNGGGDGDSDRGKTSGGNSTTVRIAPPTSGTKRSPSKMQGGVDGQTNGQQSIKRQKLSDFTTYRDDRSASVSDNHTDSS